MPRHHFTAIDLFAGCGGLSLGLEMAGFRTLLFSELNDDAAATYLRNRPQSKSGPQLLRVGDIHDLTRSGSKKLKDHLKDWRCSDIGEIDLVCGGPPCQGFSGIGHRRTFNLAKEAIPSNHLFQQMILVIKSVRPRIFLFENVAGLISSRWTPDGKKGEIFKDVIGSTIGFGTLRDYAFRWQLVHAKDYGVPQNRPRILLVGIRRDQVCLTHNRIITPDGPCEQIFGDAVQAGWLPSPTGVAPDIQDLLSDLENPQFVYGGADQAYACAPKNRIQRWLRSRNDTLVLPKGSALTDQEYSNHSDRVIAKFEYMLANEGDIPAAAQTRKFAQRVLPRRWSKSGPSVTATSLPDDFVHYSQARTLTVREWARLQTFPDWYQFCGP